jgi:hypothetical protein
MTVTVDSVIAETITLEYHQETRDGRLYLVPNLQCRLRCTLSNGGKATKYESLSLDAASHAHREVDAWLKATLSN